MQIAVTGASGHIGNVLCRLLTEKGHQVKAFYNSDPKALSGLNVELVQGSVLVKDDLSRLIAGSEVVINCAAIISISGDPKGMVFKTNTIGPKNVLDICIAEGVKKLIHVSSVHAVTELPHSQAFDETRPYKTSADFAYDYSKAEGEKSILNGAKNNSIEVIIVRPSCVIGPFDYKPSKMGKALLDIYNQKIPFLPKGGYDLVDVRDVAGSIIEAIQKGNNGEIFLLSGKYYSLIELAKVIHQVTGKKVTDKTLPYWLLKVLAPFAMVYFKLTRSDPTLTIESINALKHGHPFMNNAKAKKILNHRNRPLEETITDFFLWQPDNKNIKK